MRWIVLVNHIGYQVTLVVSLVRCAHSFLFSYPLINREGATLLVSIPSVHVCPRVIQQVHGRLARCVTSSRVPLMTLRSTAIHSDRLLVRYRLVNWAGILTLSALTLWLCYGHVTEVTRMLWLIWLCINPIVSQSISNYCVLVLLIHLFTISQVNVTLIVWCALKFAHWAVLDPLLNETVKAMLVTNRFVLRAAL